jgi:hypothetical protein
MRYRWRLSGVVVVEGKCRSDAIVARPNGRYVASIAACATDQAAPASPVVVRVELPASWHRTGLSGAV